MNIETVFHFVYRCAQLETCAPLQRKKDLLCLHFLIIFFFSFDQRYIFDVIFHVDTIQACKTWADASEKTKNVIQMPVSSSLKVFHVFISMCGQSWNTIEGKKTCLYVIQMDKCTLENNQYSYVAAELRQLTSPATCLYFMNFPYALHANFLSLLRSIIMNIVICCNFMTSIR